MPSQLFQIGFKPLLIIAAIALILFFESAVFVSASTANSATGIGPSAGSDLCSFGASCGGGAGDGGEGAAIASQIAWYEQQMALNLSDSAKSLLFTALFNYLTSPAVMAYAETNPKFAQGVYDLYHNYSTQGGPTSLATDLKNVSNTITTGPAGTTATSAATIVNKQAAVDAYQKKIDTGTVTAADKARFVAALQAAGDIIYTDPLTGKTIAYTDKVGGNVDTASGAQFALDMGYDPCLDGGGGAGSQSGSGGGTNSGTSSGTSASGGSSSGGGSVTGTESGNGSGSLGTSGGSVVLGKTSANLGVKFTAPAGALSSTAAVVISKVASDSSSYTLPANATGLFMVGDVYKITATSGSNPITSFNEPVMLTFTYTVEQIPAGISENDLKVYYYNESSKLWVEVASLVNTSTHTITATINHLTQFAIFGKNTNVCNIYTYNDWGACSNGNQSRTIFTAGPSGCTNNSSAVLTQTCVGGNTGTACTSYTYSEWSACANSSQSRTIASQLPSGCNNTSTAVLTQACTVAPCTSYTYSDWSACAGGTQSRSILTRVPAGCGDTTIAVFTQYCNASQPPTVANTTNSTQTSSSPVLSVTTDRTSSCQYNEAGGFTYGSGTTFSTTGGYNHNTSLANVNSGTHTFYVICKDNVTGGVSAALKIDFTVDLSHNPSGAPVVANVTPVKQTSSNPVLAITTDRLAVCQYKKDYSFSYGSGTLIPTTDNYSHSMSISSLADGGYVFYVVCQDKTTAAAGPATQISTVIDRSGNNTAGPVISNNTDPYQTINNPILAVATDKAAVCQYSANVFAYGAGYQFTTDGGTSHSIQLFNIGDGQHAYYVICKDPATGAMSNAGYQIIFTVSTAGGSGDCANLSSNDRKNDGNRSNSGTTGADSSYLWQSVENGTRERFAKVDWYAGYQFTPEKDGQLTQLCGYFDSGTTNKVSLYNGSYSELASAQVAGNGAWKCVDITPLAVIADTRYYVIARFQNNPVYYEYKTGLLPRKSSNTVIEAGIRQTIVNGNFMTDIVKYDYMIFGLVDVKIVNASTTASGPAINSAGPTGTVNSSSAVISAQTDQQSSCRFDREDVSYSKMKYSFSQPSGTSFSQKVCGLENGSYTFYLRCASGSGVENNASKVLQFNISQ